MDYEKLYKDALSRAKKLKETCDSKAVVGWCEYIFPELKESEDEKVRMFLLRCVKQSVTMEFLMDGISKQDCIAWLEKQGEQKPAWSEEDEEKLTNIVDMLKGNQRHRLYNITKSVSWLKSLKERMKGE